MQGIRNVDGLPLDIAIVVSVLLVGAIVAIAVYDAFRNRRKYQARERERKTKGGLE